MENGQTYRKDSATVDQCTNVDPEQPNGAIHAAPVKDHPNHTMPTKVQNVNQKVLNATPRPQQSINSIHSHAKNSTQPQNGFHSSPDAHSKPNKTTTRITKTTTTQTTTTTTTTTSTTALEPIAIIGMSYKFPQGASTDSSFWDMLLEKRCASSEFPSSRMNISAFHSTDPKRLNRIATRKAHFLDEDIQDFDAQFFGVPPHEAGPMDPQHRILMETTYHALENAGMTLEDVAGTKTSVHVGCFTSDYSTYVWRDSQRIPKYSATGGAQSILSNRLSWFFDLRGSSMTIDTACSSSMVALDLACKSLWNGSSEMAIVGGANLIFSPELNIALSNMGFLSPDGTCFSFDHRANGYARGEGFAVLVLKPLSKVAKGDSIRAVVRSIATNEDGHTPGGITQPNKDMQAALIRETYERAGLDMGLTSFFEAHGTGTLVGDPIEARAIGECFGRFHTPENPLYVGAVKSNIGHLEGTSGLAGVVKTVLALENGIIPPNANFERVNPNIDAEFFNLKFPTEPIQWPSAEIRRASVNSFGFGGSNAHVVLDDARAYMDRDFQEELHLTNGVALNGTVTVDDTASKPCHPRLLVYTSADSEGPTRQATLDSQYFSNVSEARIPTLLDDFFYTRNCRRSLFPWKSYCIVDDGRTSLKNLPSLISKPIRSPTQNRNLGFVFTGQGAQWSGMGKELFQYAVFKESVIRSQMHLRSLDEDCDWNLLEMLQSGTEDSLMDQPRFSQILTTVIQLGLVDLLESLDMLPYVVVGHSSGEIAAAYCARHVSHRSAIAISYFRGKLASGLTELDGEKHSMMAVGLSAEEARTAFKKVRQDPENDFKPESVTISCINSPNSVTVSGPEHQLDKLAEGLKKLGVFHRRLRVGLGYHSPQMQHIAPEYRKRLAGLERRQTGKDAKQSPVMVSSVTGTIVSADTVCTGQYWVDNMVMPVNFLDAVKTCCSAHAQDTIVKKLDRSHTKTLVTHALLEIGPHATLKAPVKEILGLSKRDQEVTYCSALVRKRSANETFLQAVGTLFCSGFHVDMQGVTSLTLKPGKTPSLLTDLPSYPFEHSVPHWEESQRNKDFRFRKHPNHDLLGTQYDFNPLESKWRLIIKEEELPWIKDHKVNGAVLYPAAGMLAMAIEAAKQLLCDRLPDAFELENVEFIAPILISGSAAADGLEVQITLTSNGALEIKTNSEFKFRIFVQKAGGSGWDEVSRGVIRADYGETISDVDDGRESKEKINSIRSNFNEACRSCDTRLEQAHLYESIKKDIGIDYGPAFQPLDGIQFNSHGEALAVMQPYDSPCTEHTIHPTSLDGVFQLGFAALTGGDFKEIPTMVPRRLGRLWISIGGAGHPNAGTERIHTQARILSTRTATADANVLRVDGLELAVRIEDLEITAVSSPEAPKTLDDADHICHYMEWKVDLDMLSPKQTQAFCEEVRDKTIEPVEWADYMDLMMFSFAANAFEALKSADSPVVDALQSYALWLREQLEGFLHSNKDILPTLFDKDHLRSLYDKVLPSAIAKAYIIVGENLTDLFLGKVDPLQLLFEDEKLMADFYTELIGRSSAIDPIRRYLDCLVHKWPALKFLEVGAGTGASSEEILNVINNPKTGTRFESYTFTDISPSFFEKAQLRLQNHGDRMIYRVLNVEEDPKEQGFANEKYDVIVAANVLHATQDLRVSLDNLRQLLRPGGKLILEEMTTPKKVITGFTFGLLPGWWRAVEDYRIAQRSPAISEEQWDQVLKEAGFTGTDLSLHDFAAENCYTWSFMVSTLAKPYTNGVNGHSDVSGPIIIHDPTSALQSQVAQFVSQELGIPEKSVGTGALDIASTTDSERRDYILLNGLDENLLWDLDSSFLQKLQNIVATAKTILWVTGGGGHSPSSPKFGIANGLIRVIRQEDNRVTLKTLSLDISPSATSLDENSLRLVAAAFQTHEVEPEYLEVENKLCINRLVTAREVDEHIFSRLENPVIPQEIGERQLRLGVRVPGLLDTMEFAEEESMSSPLEPDEVVIQVKALGVNFKDCLTMLGRVDTDIMGSECAGIIRQVGSDCGNDFKPGDRVVAAALDSYRTFVRIRKHTVQKIPDKMSFVEAASFPTAFCTALYSLVNVARLQKGESILIHAASGGTGQAAVQMALLLGAEVFATVGSSSKKKLLMERYGLPEDHIFYSRNTSFADGVKRVTKGRGVDVVLNSVSGRLLEASWDSVAPFGRFIEIGRKDVDTRGYLPMYPFIKNLSFSGVDLTMVLQTNIKVGQQLLTEVMSLAEKGEIRPVFPLHPYKVADVEQAFRFMQSGKSSGKIVLELENDHVVPTVVSSKPEYSLYDNATYLVAGGLGGIGRRIAAWLVGRGAKHLILLSRTGLGDNERAIKLVEELRSQGVEVRCPRGDISDLTSLKQALEECSDMPQIRGSFHAAMAIRDTTFPTLSIDDWRQCTLPKIQGSWNLHLALPSKMDFFILLSSACGVFGNAGQCSYAAGNTFLDALAQFRTAQGERTVALDLGILLGEGYVAENEQVMTKLLRMNLLAPTALEKVFAMFDYYCKPSRQFSARHSQLCSGYELPVNAKAKGLDVHTTMLTPLFRHMHQIKSSDQLHSTSGNQTKNFRSLFIDATSMAEAQAIASEGLQTKLSRVLGLPVASIELDRHLESYGVDSLVALELRNWMTKEMGADVAVFELLGGSTLADIGATIAAKSSLRKTS